MSLSRSTLFSFSLAAVLLFTASSKPAQAQGLGIEPPYVGGDPLSTLADRSAIARIWAELQARKNAVIPASIGAWHWWRIPTGGPDLDGSSSPLNTPFYYLMLDPTWQADGRYMKSFGLHVELRFREETAARASHDAVIWPFELYGWAETAAGVFKAGQIRRKFGLDWDGSFYGNTAYYDGLKLNADLGVSWERTFWIRSRFSIESSMQFFFREDGISPGLLGADSESSAVFRLQNHAVARVVPTWWFSPTSSLALGLSCSLGQVRARDAAFDDHAFSAWGVDLTYTRDRFKVFAEVQQRRGALTPVRYLSGGMSSRTTDALIGMSYATGAVTWRMTYSAGYDHDPAARQQMFVPGVTIAVTKNIDLYLEYVKWTAKAAGASTITFENGVQAAINWRF